MQHPAERREELPGMSEEWLTSKYRSFRTDKVFRSLEEIIRKAKIELCVIRQSISGFIIGKPTDLGHAVFALSAQATGGGRRSPSQKRSESGGFKVWMQVLAEGPLQVTVLSSPLHKFSLWRV